jgi:flagellar biosynthetic protein FliP
MTTCEHDRTATGDGGRRRHGARRAALLRTLMASSMALAGMLLAALPALADQIEQQKTFLGYMGEDDLTTSVKLVVFFTALALIPALVVSVTSFTRVVVVLGFLRQAMGVQSIPPNPVLMGVAMMLSVYIMSPTIAQVHGEAVQPLLDGQISEEEALSRGAKPLRRFMMHQTREKDLALFVQLARQPRPQSREDIPLHVLVPSFMISELRKAFEIGFTLFLPFLVIDMVIASVLMSMGMMMLPPVIISLPFKVLLFVLVDGWNLVARGLVSGFA